MASISVLKSLGDELGFIETPQFVARIGVSTTSITISGTAELAKVWDHIREYNSKYEGPGSHLGDLRYLDTNIDAKDDGIYAIVTFNIGTFDSERPRVGLQVWTLSVGTLEKPLETKSGYDKNWNFDKLTKAAVEDEYKKPGTYDRETWITTKGYTIIDATKPGVEAYLLPSPVSEQRTYFATRDEADDAARSVGDRINPSETFGIFGGDWLVMSAEVRKNGDLWERIVRYQFADDWDNDLYGLTI